MTWKEAKSLKNVIFKLTIFKSNKNIEIHDWTHILLPVVALFLKIKITYTPLPFLHQPLVAKIVKLKRKNSVKRKSYQCDDLCKTNKSGVFT